MGGVGGVGLLQIVTKQPTRPAVNLNLGGQVNRPTDHLVFPVKDVRFHFKDLQSQQILADGENTVQIIVMSDDEGIRPLVLGGNEQQGHLSRSANHKGWNDFPLSGNR